MAGTGTLDVIKADTRNAEAPAKAFVPRHEPEQYIPIQPSGLERDDELPIGVENRLVSRFVERALLGAVVKRYPDGSWFADIPVVAGVWANEATEEATLEELEVVLRGWIEVKMDAGDKDFPVIDGVNLNVL